jgi:hypothetical protein
MGIVWARLALGGVMGMGQVWALRVIYGVGLSDSWRAVWRPAVGVAVMACVLAALGQSAVLAGVLLPLRLMMEVLLGAVVYAFTLWALWQLAGRPDGVESFVLDWLTKKTALPWQGRLQKSRS